MTKEALDIAIEELERQLVILKFWRRVDMTGPCWLWTGACSNSGHGLITINRVVQRTHRFSWQLVHGPIADGLFVCHHCDVPNCVNPDHLFLGTAEDNTRDMVQKGRAAAGGHRYNPKLSDEDVAALRQRYAAGGVTQKALAAEYGVSEQWVHQLINGRDRKAALRILKAKAL